MTELRRHRLDRWRLDEVLLKYPGLRLAPTRNSEVQVAGMLAFDAQPQRTMRLADEYEVKLSFPSGSREIPRVRETGGRIPHSFHHLEDGCLCLASETNLRLILAGSPTGLGFVEKCVIPYLYGYSYFERYGQMPFGELEHGTPGIIQDLAFLYGTPREDVLLDFIRLTAMRKRFANKQPCPCGSKRRLGRCHNRQVNALRSGLGRQWFRGQ